MLSKTKHPGNREVYQNDCFIDFFSITLIYAFILSSTPAYSWKSWKPHGLDRCTFCRVKNWLDDQPQRVLVNGAASSWHLVTFGVSQGSVLGPFPDDLDKRIESSIANSRTIPSWVGVLICRRLGRLCREGPEQAG